MTKTKRLIGKVISWHGTYGFVRVTETGAEYYCHFSSIAADGYRVLTVGQVVEFELGPRPSKPNDSRVQANNVTILQDADDNIGNREAANGAD